VGKRGWWEDFALEGRRWVVRSDYIQSASRSSIQDDSVSGLISVWDIREWVGVREFRELFFFEVM
jgi:hypothetical protein